MATRTKESYTIQSVLHALDVLEELQDDQAKFGVTELAQKLGLQKNSVFRLLATLETRGYVVQNPDTEQYHLGVKAFELGQAYLHQTDLVDLAQPVLDQLQAETQETVCLAVLEGSETVYLSVVQSQQRVRVFADIGMHVPAIQAASGRAIMAYMTPSERKTPVDLIPYTSNVELRRLERSFRAIRKDVYATDMGILDQDVTSIAAPIFDHNGKAIATITLQVPISRASKDRQIQPYVQKVQAAAKTLTNKMGGQTPE